MEEIDLKELLLIFWRKKILIIVITLIFIIIGVIYSYNFVVEDYKSSTTLILGRINSSTTDGTEISQTNQITQSEITINSNLISTYSELIKSNTLIKQVIDNLKINISEKQLKKSITVSRISETELIEITVKNSDPKLASEIANEIAKVFSTKIEEIYNISNVYIIDPATENNIPYNINHPKDVVIFAAVGFILACAYILVYSMLDNTVKNESDIENEIGLKTLISIPLRKNTDKEETELITYEDGKAVISETFRTLRTNVQFSNVNNKENKVMLVTSCFSSEGKSYVSANLAVTFAQTGKKVILVDTDMRKGRQSKVFRIPNNLGLSNYLSGLDRNGVEIDKSINEYINETEIKNLNVITSGSIPPNPSELLTSNKLPKLIKDLSSVYDLIIFDGAPVLPIADSLILTRMANSTILVSAFNKTKKEELIKAKKDIQNVGGRIVGVVLNKVNVPGTEYKNKYYYYSVEEEKNKKKNKKKVDKKPKVKLKKRIINLKNKIINFLYNKKKKINVNPKLLTEKNISKKIVNKDDIEYFDKQSNEISLYEIQEDLDEELEDEYELEYDEQELDFNDEEYKMAIEEEKRIAEEKARIAREEEERKIAEEKARIAKEKEEEKKRLEEEKERIKKQKEEQAKIEKLEKENAKIKKKAEKEQKKYQRKEQLNIKKEEFNNYRKEKLVAFNKFKNTKLNELSDFALDKKNQMQRIADNFAESISKKREERDIKQEEKRKEKEEQNKINRIKLEEEVAKLVEIRKNIEKEREKTRAIQEEQAAKEQEEYERKLELQKIEKEKREQEERKRIEEETRIKAEKRAEQIEIRKREREEQLRLREERNLKRQEFLKEQKARKEKEKEEKRKLKELEKQKQKEEALIQEQLMEDNLYPKTKYNKSL